MARKSEPGTLSARQAERSASTKMGGRHRSPSRAECLSTPARTEHEHEKLGAWLAGGSCCCATGHASTQRSGATWHAQQRCHWRCLRPRQRFGMGSSPLRAVFFALATAAAAAVIVAADAAVPIRVQPTAVESQVLDAWVERLGGAHLLERALAQTFPPLTATQQQEQQLEQQHGPFHLCQRRSSMSSNSMSSRFSSSRGRTPPPPSPPPPHRPTPPAGARCARTTSASPRRPRCCTPLVLSASATTTPSTAAACGGPEAPWRRSRATPRRRCSTWTAWLRCFRRQRAAPTCARTSCATQAPGRPSATCCSWPVTRLERREGTGARGPPQRCRRRRRWQRCCGASASSSWR